MLHAPPGLSAADGTSHAALCPSCNTSRIGNFRFCLSCLHDFDQGAPRGLSDASVGMARARSAEMALAAPTAEAAVAPPTIEAAAVEPAVDILALAPAQSLTEPRSATIERLIHSLETRVERETRAEPIATPRVVRVTVQPSRRRIPRRLSLIVAAIAIALLGVSGALLLVLGRGAGAGQLGDRPAAAAASPSAILSPTPIPTYSAAIRPGPITFGTKLSGVTVADPTNRIKIGNQIIWVAHLSQPTVEPDVNISITAIVSDMEIVFHQESSTIGLKGTISANPGVNSRDLGLGTFMVRYTSQGTILAEGTFTVVK